MSDVKTRNDIVNAIAVAAKSLESRKDEINRLNVFPVPDGDTGTNMSLTLKMVVDNLAKLPIGASSAETRKAITNGALMGARGNSGVITSQILRGFCEGYEGYEALSVEALDTCFSKAVDVSFKAVRKPVEGTILTVIKDSAAAARQAHKKKMELEDAFSFIVDAAYESVQHTPDLLPVLKENNVVDAGGFGLAMFLDAFYRALFGKDGELTDALAFSRPAPKVEIEQINDWAGSAYRYCTEFLVHSDTIDVDGAKEFLPTMGDCDLMVGMHPNFKVHVHSNRPDQVLCYFLTHDAQISEVHIHNMQLQSEERTEKLEAEQAQPKKPLGIVAVAPGEGNAKILQSLGVDVVVSGGQTMNPSTADLLEAANSVAAESVIIMPNNSNIIMAAQSAAQLSTKPVAVVPTKTVPQSFSALFGFNAEASLDENVEAMTEAFSEVKTGEITTAIKDSKDAHGNPIKDGDVIGIADGSIEAVGSSLLEVLGMLLEVMEADDADTCTLLAGEQLSDDEFDEITSFIEDKYEDLEIDPHRGEQPLYPLVFSLE